MVVKPTFFIPGLFALWFFCVFHLATAAPTSTGHLQRRQSSLLAYVREYGKRTTADGGGHNFQLVPLMDMMQEYARRLCPPPRAKGSQLFTVL
jgi:hypothetical protein